MSVEATKVKAPWLAFYGVVPEHLQYPDCTMYEAVERCAQKYPSYPASYIVQSGYCRCSGTTP